MTPGSPSDADREEGGAAEVPAAPTESAGEAPTIPLRPWQVGLAPHFIALFLLIVFFDRLGPTTLGVGGLASSVFGAIVGSLALYVCLFLGPALLGLGTRRTLADLGETAFGRSGGRWVGDFVLLGLVPWAWFAVAIGAAADLSVKALFLAGLLSPEQLAPLAIGGMPLAGGLVYLATVVAWSLSAAVLGPLLIRIVSAILYAYVVFPALVFGGLMVWALPGLPSFPAMDWSWGAVWSMVQLVFGFGAAGGLAGAVDWGAASPTARDIKLGGLVGLLLTPPIVASIALVTVAGASGRVAAGLDPAGRVRHVTEMASSAPGTLVRGPAPEVLVYHRAVLEGGVGGSLGCALLMTFCLALLGPSCYAPAVYRDSFHRMGPGVPKLAWAVIGAVAAWPLMASGFALRLEIMFGLMGAAMAAAAGVLTSVAIGARRGAGLAGVVAWLVGLGVGLVPYVGQAIGTRELVRVQPAALLAWGAAFLVHTILARLGRRTVEVSNSETGSSSVGAGPIEPGDTL